MTDPHEIADVFNNYYTKSRANLASKSQTELYIYEASNFFLNLLPSTPSEIVKIIKELCNTAAGYDQVRARVPKYVTEIIAVPLYNWRKLPEDI